MYSVYIENQGITDEYAIKAAEHIDILTFNRIKDFNSLTEFQQRTITRVHEKLTEFERDNEDVLGSQLQSYSINGVSMSVEANSLKKVCGVAIPSELYSQLVSTGLADYSNSDKGVTSIVSTTPYARRLYFHPEYNFSTKEHKNAGAEWFIPWQKGGTRENFCVDTFAKIYRGLCGL